MKTIANGLLFTALLLSVSAGRAAELHATLHYAQVVELGVPVSGVVDNVHVTEGQQVKKGTLMLELDEIPFLAELNQGKADLKRLAAERDEAKKALDRDLELYDRMVLSTVDLDKQKLAYTQADSQYQSQQAQLSLAEYHYSGSKLHAPFDGLVISSHGYPGMAVHVELKPPVLFLFANTSRLSAEADVPADKLSGMSIGDSVTVLVAGKQYPGKINSVTLTSEGRSLSQPSQYRIRVLLDAKDNGLMPGQAASLITGNHQGQ